MINFYVKNFSVICNKMHALLIYIIFLKVPTKETLLLEVA